MNFLKISNFTSGFRRLKGMSTVCPALLMVLLILAPVDGAWNQTPEAEGEKPEMEMLEFLGSFEDKDTGWMDPFELEAMAKEKGTTEENSNDK